MEPEVILILLMLDIAERPRRTHVARFNLISNQHEDLTATVQLISRNNKPKNEQYEGL
jgi:hypothetical protein